ncbi:MAG: Gfo/Idh/MocA family protein [Gemmatimonas sp.]
MDASARTTQLHDNSGTLRTSVEPVRWGILGAASIAVRQVIPATQESPLCSVLAIASRDIAKARMAAESLDIPRAYASYEELLDDPDIEAVYNPLPNHLHVPWTVRAAERGKHVLCEKPIAMNAREAETLREVQQRTGVQIAEAFMVRLHPQWAAAREILHAGKIGELRLVNGHFTYFRRDASDVRSRPEWGGGALLDIGCYLATMTRWLFESEPIEVIGQLELDPEFGVDRVGSALLRFPTGQAGFTFGGQVALHQHMKVFGTRGHLTIPVPFSRPATAPSKLLLDDARDLLGGGLEEMVIPPAGQFTLQATRFAEAVRGLNTTAVSLDDSIRNMRVLDAIAKSATTRQWEAVGPTLSI